MNDDAELLSEYARSGSEAAFTELVRRHIDLVHSAALRLTGGDAHRAEDVSQQVFTELARQAARLANHTALLGWLYTTTRRMALRAVRTEQRRTAREQEASMMNELLDKPDPQPAWDHLRPVLEDAMHGLGDTDRLALLCRFFKNQSLKDVGLSLGLTENAARMRVDRALEKLHRHLIRRGRATTATALAGVLSVNAVQSAPAGLAASLAAASLVTVAAGAGTTFTLLNLMSLTKLKLGILGAVLVAGVTTPLVMQHRSEVRLREENRVLQEQMNDLAGLRSENRRLAALISTTDKPLTLRTPAPPLRSAPPPSNSTFDGMPSTNLLAQLMFGTNWPTLSAELVESYLKQNHRNAQSLLAVFRANGDEKMLAEALEKYPNDPQVNYAGIFQKDIPPEEKRRRLDAFKQSAPDNALANYLSAIDHFKAGRTDQAVEDLSTAAGKRQFQDYSWTFVQNAEEAYRLAGYPESEAKMIAGTSLLLPQLKDLKYFTYDIINLANSYRQAGDEQSAQAAMQIAVGLGQRFDPNEQGGYYILNNLVGLAIQRIALDSMDPASPYGSDGHTVKERIDELNRQRDAIKALGAKLETIFPKMPNQDWISYQDRERVFGEQAASRWLIEKYGGR